MWVFGCLNCHQDYEVPDDEVALTFADGHRAGLTVEEFSELLAAQTEKAVQLVEGCVDGDGTWQVRGGLDLEIVYHECSGGLLTSTANRQVMVYVGDDDDGAAGVPARPSEPLDGPGAAIQREVGD
jgi:hypothetical protein